MSVLGDKLEKLAREKFFAKGCSLLQFISAAIGITKVRWRTDFLESTALLCGACDHRIIIGTVERAGGAPAYSFGAMAAGRYIEWVTTADDQSNRQPLESSLVCPGAGNRHHDGSSASRFRNSSDRAA